jgi:hypothetical protein
MKVEYQFKYNETKEVLTEIMKLHGLSKIKMNFRIVTAVGGVFVFICMFLWSDFFNGGAGSAILGFFKFVAGWALAFVIAEVLSRTIGKKIELLASAGDAQTVYEKRLKIWKKPLNVKVDFYEDSCVSIVEKNKKVITYEKVQRILESEEIIAFIVEGEEFGKRFFGISKAGLVDAQMDDFREFLLRKCIGVQKGI